MVKTIVPRKIQSHIESALFKGKIIVIYGARQVGKTTLVKEIQKLYPNDSLYLSCDEPDIREALTDKTSTELKALAGSSRLVILDEAQRVKNIGITLKLFIDNFPEVQCVATGSSSFDLANKIIEPLTGRKHEFYLYPLSIEELKPLYSELEIKRLLERRIIFGMYPEVAEGGDDAEERLKEIARSYLYKDILQFDAIKNSEAIEKLLRALALQIGNEVSYNELASTVGINKNTINRYIQLLEKAFIIFRLNPFGRNLRNELKKLRKIYFYDTGIRNALINNFNLFALRQDVGTLWENFMISERLKFNNNNNGRYPNIYFWRTHQGGEIDYIEESGGALSAFEFKWDKAKYRLPQIFKETYDVRGLEVITRNNFSAFVGMGE